MGVILAALSAFVYGIADFAGGRATRYAPSQVVTLVSQLGGFVPVLALVLFVPSDGPTARNLVAGAIGGLCGGAGLMLLYHGLSVGTMSLVSPVCAVVAAIVPVVAGVVGGDRPGAWSLLGIGVAITAIALVGLSGPLGANRRGLGAALGAGAGFGFFFVALAHSGGRPGLWPLVAARPASMALAWLMAHRAGVRITLGGAPPTLVLGAGILDMTANLLFLFAAGRGQLAIVGVVASLYPTSTVMLAGWLDHERLHPVQWVGLGAAAAALALVSLP